MAFKEGKWDMRILQDQGYRVGSIVRVKMINFLTYDDCEVFPGPRLNVVLGPNGTGKSTITHAICLACGGTPGTVGRSPDLSQFVKQGKEGKECYVEVDILSSMQSICTIRRSIHSENNKSEWCKNTKATTQAIIKQTVAELNIDVDNLCTFMPQDKVGSFTQQTPRGILEKTLQCIPSPSGTGTLYDEQMELAATEQVKMTRQRELDDKQNEVERITNQLNGMRAEVERAQARIDAQEKLDLYSLKKLVIEFELSENEFVEKQRKVDEANAKLVKAKESIDPLEKKERNLKHQQEAREKTCEIAAKKYKDLEKKLNQQEKDVEEKDTELTDALHDLEDVDHKRRQLLDQQRSEERKLQDLENKLIQAEEDVEGREVRWEEILKMLEAKEAELSPLEEEIEVKAAARRESQEQQRKATNEFQNLQDPQQVFKDKLQRGGFGHLSQNVYRALDWLEKNKHQFQDEVFGPVAMHVKVEDSACAMMLESSMSLNKHLGFLVRNERDKRLLLAQNFKVDIFTMNNTNIPRSSHQKEKIEQFRDIGMQGTLAHQIECPDVVQAFLCSFGFVHQILWARQDGACDKIGDRHFERLCPQGSSEPIRLYVQVLKADSTGRRGSKPSFDIMDYNCSRSKYNPSQRPTVSSNTISSKYNLFEGRGDDVGTKKKELEDKIEQAREAYAKADMEVEELRKKEAKIRQEISDLKVEKGHLLRLKKEPDTIRLRIASCKKTLTDFQQKLSVDADSLRRDKLKIYKKKMAAFQKAIAEVAKLGELCIDHHCSWAIAEGIRSELQSALRNASSELSDAKRKLHDFEREVHRAQRERDECNRTKTEKEREIEERQDQLGGQDEFDKAYEKAILLCPEDNLEAIEFQITQLDRQIRSSVENSDVLQLFDRTQEELTRAEVELARMKTNVADAAANLADKRRDWDDAVAVLTKKLNDHFSEFMSKLQNKGNVELRALGTIGQFEMQMQVSFREDADLADLSGQRHSGGERAVATIMYLMALQEMTRSPFRVVDEINQGMDERNERLVFDRIVQSCCGDKAKPQYFLISPKLLEGLRSMENDDVTVLLVWNGPGVQSKWQLKDLISGIKRKKEREHVLTDGDGGDAGKKSDDVVDPPEASPLLKKGRKTSNA